MNIYLHRSLTILIVRAWSLAVLTSCFPPTNLPIGAAGTSGGSTSSMGGSTSPVTAIQGVDWQLVIVVGTSAVPGSEATMALANGKVRRNDRL